MLELQLSRRRSVRTHHRNIEKIDSAFTRRTDRFELELDRERPSRAKSPEMPLLYLSTICAADFQ